MNTRSITFDAVSGSTVENNLNGDSKGQTDEKYSPSSDATTSIETLVDIRVKWTALRAQMDNFIDSHITTPSSHAKENASRHIQAKVVKPDFLYSLSNIVPAAPLDDPVWLDISRTFPSASVHSACGGTPSVAETIVRKALAMSDSPTCVEFESMNCEVEDVIVKKPDGALYATDEASRAITALVAPMVIKPQKRLADVIDQALGYLVSRLRAQLDLVDPLTSELHGYCLGFDGSRVVLGFAAVRNLKFYVYTTDRKGMSLWPRTENPHPASETRGFRALRTLFGASLEQLGHVVDTLKIDNTIQLTHLLGTGSFCDVYSVKRLDRPDAPPCILKKPTKASVSMQQKATSDQLAHIQRERDILYVFTQANLVILPRLVRENLESPFSPYLLIEPAGVPLTELLHRQPQTKRAQCAADMLIDCTKALDAALQLGYCHSDIGVENIIYANGNYFLVDWGLARAPGAPMHNYTGRLAFMHDELVNHMFVVDEAKECASFGMPSQLPASIPYLPEYDRQALQYVAYAMRRGQFMLEQPWEGSTGAILIEDRKKWLAAGPYVDEIA